MKRQTRLGDLGALGGPEAKPCVSLGPKHAALSSACPVDWGGRTAQGLSEEPQLPRGTLGQSPAHKFWGQQLPPADAPPSTGLVLPLYVRWTFADWMDGWMGGYTEDK